MIIRIKRNFFVLIVNYLYTFNCFFVNVVKANDNEWILEADGIVDRRVNPVLANGHIGFTVFDTSVYMNGLYNGRGADTHRARIENHANLQTSICSTKARAAKSKCRYRFNIKTGIFEVIFENTDYKMKHEVFPHRFYTRTIVNRFTVERKASKEEIQIPISMDFGVVALDITFPDRNNYTKKGLDVIIESGHTLQVENEEFQKETQKVSFAYTKISELLLPVRDYKLTKLAFMTIDSEKDVVEREIERVITDSQVVEKHEKEWTQFWNNFDIEIENRIELAPKIRSSIYYVVSNLPSTNSFIVNRPFYGVSTSGLGNVGDDNQIKGRITWDMEMYMLPAVMLIDPYWSEQMLNYRYRVHAEDPLSKGGWNYFWETAYTGQHLDVYREMMKATHVPADVAFATRLHLSATHNQQWFRKEGCELAFYTAKYWADRTEYNGTSDLYDLKIVKASNFDDPITNNAFVNVAVGYNLYLGEFAACMCKDHLQGKKGLKQNWNEIARSLTLPYDDKDEFVKEHSGYEEYIRTTAADMALINYPLQYPFEDDVKRNTLSHYRKLQIKNSPPTTWASHIIGDIELRNVKEETSLFYDINYFYIERPFNIWTDRVASLDRIYNFVSGAAAYLQIYMNGYAGIKIYFDRMEIKNPKLPPDSTKLKIKGVTYLSAKFDLTIHENKYMLTMKELPKNEVELIGVQDDGRIYKFVKAGDTISTGINSTIAVKERHYPYGDCEMPKNIIGIPKKQLSLIPLRERARANGGRVIIGCLLFAFIAVLCAFAFVVYKRHGSIFPSNSVRYVRNV